MKKNRFLKYLIREIPTRILLCKAALAKKKLDSPESPPSVTLVLLISRPHDLDLYLDIYMESLSRPEIDVIFWARRKALKHFPATRKLLEKYNIDINFTVGHGNLREALDKFKKIDALINTVESSIAKHKVAYRLVRLANAAGVLTYTMQHGFENVGLTYIDTDLGSGVTFAARKVLTWGPVDSLPGKLASDTIRKCTGVGCPKIYLSSKKKTGVSLHSTPIISIFEGLHVDRFDNRYIRQFFQDLRAMSDEFIDTHFVLKPHPGLTKRAAIHQQGIDSLKRKKNVEVLDPSDPEACVRWTTPELLASSIAALTTPSTIALDAALAGTPAAVIRYGQQIPYYELYAPLPMVDSTDDWRKFLTDVHNDKASMKKLTSEFLKRQVLPGNAAKRILEQVVADCMKTKVVCSV
ncbi:MAG: hypothetical protein B1H12_10210 [Desulfobacteraceae bacterium 4484_190.2]|nr:MAG: hypothetical protein B1H12_10210 [Desulfobacteraceae bacterium 4484_190.2]